MQIYLWYQKAKQAILHLIYTLQQELVIITHILKILTNSSQHSVKKQEHFYFISK